MEGFKAHLADPPDMGAEVECSRCGETFESQDDLVYHSIDAHAGTTTTGGTAQEDDAEEIDEETVAALLTALDERTAAGTGLRVRYGQRFLLAAGTVILGIVLVLSYLRLRGFVEPTVYLFSLGVLFGIALSYLQAFVQAALR